MVTPLASGARINIIQRLPAELQLCVLDNLTYIDAIRLSQASKYFQSRVDPHKWPTAEKASSIYKAQFWDQHNSPYYVNRHEQYKTRKIKVKTDGYACFGCFSVLDMSAFSQSQTTRHGAKGSGASKHVGYNRLCIECGQLQGAYKLGTFLKSVTYRARALSHGGEIRVQNSTDLVVCPACEDVCEYIVTSPPEICKDCEAVQAHIDKSDDGMETLQRRVNGLLTIECKGCGECCNIRASRKRKFCAGCWEGICGRCFAFVARGSSCLQCKTLGNTPRPEEGVPAAFTPRPHSEGESEADVAKGGVRSVSEMGECVDVEAFAFLQSFSFEDGVQGRSRRSSY
ncbi:hypothetical protein LTR37_019609 [Vermiconidia calcicola]|uniref:Uncharacterized protein n=1 Tax=Vermiconidia calcicola TaxID=1690605 RepID=A0ACC3MF55_9PEZI|nr:hypothetical protein LTR37_019609 [Vermiconidia calcicola]